MSRGATPKSLCNGIKAFCTTSGSCTPRLNQRASRAEEAEAGGDPFIRTALILQSIDIASSSASSASRRPPIQRLTQRIHHTKSRIPR